MPEGWAQLIAGQSWRVTRTTRAGGKVISVDAERLSDTEQLGANMWMMSELSEEKVMQFLRAAATAFLSMSELVLRLCSLACPILLAGE